MKVLVWVLAVTGLAVWGAVVVWAVAVFVEPHSSPFLSYECNDCGWWVRDPENRRWWTIRPQYRWHRVTAHHDWPPHYRRTGRVS